jgi:N-formylglutamate deformylase
MIAGYPRCWFNAFMQDLAPFTLVGTAEQTVPVILTSPHSGRHYDKAFLAASRLDALAIRRSEDSFVEELFGAAPVLGAPLLAANFPRAWCDANREPWELDPAMFADRLPDYVNVSSPRVTAGLGTIARIVGTGEAIYAGKLSFAEAKARIGGFWQPYHEALRGLISATRARFGACLVIDCHSMPSIAGRANARPDIVLGDGHGTSCTPAVLATMQAVFSRLGLNVRCNDPYAGGYITRHYGRPREGVQVVQVEVARGLYMNERTYGKSESFGAVQGLISEFLADVLAASAGLLGGAAPALAAE